MWQRAVGQAWLEPGLELRLGSVDLGRTNCIERQWREGGGLPGGSSPEKRMPTTTVGRRGGHGRYGAPPAWGRMATGTAHAGDPDGGHGASSRGSASSRACRDGGGGADSRSGGRATRWRRVSRVPKGAQTSRARSFYAQTSRGSGLAARLAAGHGRRCRTRHACVTRASRG